MKTFGTHFIEKLQTSAWTVPTFCTFCGIILSQILLWMDYSTDLGEVEWIQFIGGGTPEGARSLLSTIATSMLAITGVSFSSIIVALTLASQQFGPRLLRNFIRDTFSQSVLGVLIGTFVYCLLVMRGVKGGDSSEFLPHLSIIGAMLLALLSLGFFIKFIHHIVNLIQGELVVAEAFQFLENAITNVFPDPEKDRPEQREAGHELDGWFIESGKTGYVQAVNIQRLVEIAEEHDLVLETDCRAGHFVSQKNKLLRVVRGPSKEDMDDELLKDLRAAIFTGEVRTPEQDHQYGIRQLVEVALRALSPGINDPFTAMNCIDYLGAGLQLALRSPLPASVHRDEDGEIRVYSWRTTHSNLVEAVCNQIRQAAVDRCDVSCRLLEMLALVATQCVNNDQTEALKTQAYLILNDTVPRMTNDHDARALKSRHEAMVDACKSFDK